MRVPKDLLGTYFTTMNEVMYLWYVRLSLARGSGVY